MSEVFTSLFFQLAVGGIGGFFIGYLIKKVVKLALLLGIVIFALIFLAYQNVISLNFRGLVEAISNLTKVVNPTFSLLAPFLASLPFVGSLAVGLVVGLKMG